MDGQLRGCIGSLSATCTHRVRGPGQCAERRLSRPALFTLEQKGTGQVHIEVSVLSEPTPLAYTDADDLLSRLRARHRWGDHQKGRCQRHVFTPGVGAAAPAGTVSLSPVHESRPACRWVAGRDLTVLVYQVQYFEEAR
jgi:hypothetical protein